MSLINEALKRAQAEKHRNTAGDDAAPEIPVPPMPQIPEPPSRRWRAAQTVFMSFALMTVAAAGVWFWKTHYGPPQEAEASGTKVARSRAPTPDHVARGSAPTLGRAGRSSAPAAARVVRGNSPAADHAVRAGPLATDRLAWDDIPTTDPLARGNTPKSDHVARGDPPVAPPLRATASLTTVAGSRRADPPADRDFGSLNYFMDSARARLMASPAATESAPSVDNVGRGNAPGLHLKSEISNPELQIPENVGRSSAPATTSVASPSSEPAVDTPKFQVTSISVGTRTATAVINGHLVGVGDKVGDAKVLAITPRAVDIEISGKRVTLRM